jgi:hypothetical protein
VSKTWFPLPSVAEIFCNAEAAAKKKRNSFQKVAAIFQIYNRDAT